MKVKQTSNRWDLSFKHKGLNLRLFAMLVELQTHFVEKIFR
jgi:hypothetical protein